MAKKKSSGKSSGYASSLGPAQSPGFAAGNALAAQKAKGSKVPAKTVSYTGPGPGKESNGFPKGGSSSMSKGSGYARVPGVKKISGK